MVARRDALHLRQARQAGCVEQRREAHAALIDDADARPEHLAISHDVG